jgi:diguanylate cyclase (GGDEF)-like protein
MKVGNGDKASVLSGRESAAVQDWEFHREFYELVELAAALCETPVSVVSLMDESGQWLTASVGIEDRRTARDLAFCAYAMAQNELFVVRDADTDERFATHPLVIGGPQVRFYAGIRVNAPDGAAIGTFCIADHQPRRLTAQQESMLRVLARQVSMSIELRAKRRTTVTEMERNAELARYQAELEAANDRLRRLAVTDDLTGLRNRRAFDERLAFEFSMARRKNRDLAVVLLDADDFKKVNDRLGHAAGDSVLQQLASVLQHTVRLTDLAVRFGGEEFAVILPESDERSALMWCGRMQRALSSTGWDHQPVTVSMGAAGLTAACMDGSHLVAMADQALYRAKRKGKNCFVGSGDAEIERAG